MELAQQFASLIDTSSFDEAAALIAEDCAYHYWEGNYQGRDAIIAIYRQNYLQSRKIFDEINYSSDVEAMGDGTYKITFLDKYRKGHKWHDSRCFQIITIKDNLIVEIQHNEIPGEAEALRTFYRIQSNRSNI